MPKTSCDLILWVSRRSDGEGFLERSPAIYDPLPFRTVLDFAGGDILDCTLTMVACSLERY